jgi:hypothetical protein
MRTPGRGASGHHRAQLCDHELVRCQSSIDYANMFFGFILHYNTPSVLYIIILRLNSIILRCSPHRRKQTSAIRKKALEHTVSAACFKLFALLRLLRWAPSSSRPQAGRAARRARCQLRAQLPQLPHSLSPRLTRCLTHASHPKVALWVSDHSSTNTWCWRDGAGPDCPLASWPRASTRVPA